jgi:tRNA dimethylallyltransferase
MPKPKVITIVGPTASGKTALSISLATQFNGEVISADSRQVYRGMDLGTGKVTTEEMAGIPHHLLDIADPAIDTYTGADFVHDASVAITDITEHGHVPIIAGGTFFYLDLLRGLRSSAPVPPNETLRTELETKSTEELSALLTTRDPRRAASIDHDNRRRLIRALEIVDGMGSVPETTVADSLHDVLMLGIDVPIEMLNERIHRRITDRIDQGMIEEIANLHSKGVSYERMASFGLEYRSAASFLQGHISKDEMVTELAAKTRQFAKRQRLWLKNDPSIIWLPFPVNTENAVKHVEEFLKNSAS